MREKRRFSAPAVGGSSLLIIFAVLCLTVLALLSLATVRADDRLSQAAADSVTAYYAADAQAEKILAQLRAGERPAGVSVEQKTGENGETAQVCTYTCEISDTQELAVSVELRGENDYTVLRWQAVSTAAWTPDESITVWDGEDFAWN